MVELGQVTSGISKYIDSEILPKISGLNRWIVGAGASMMLNNSSVIFNQMKENPVIKSMDVINKDDEIDIDKLYSSILEQAKKSAVTFDVPLVGAITLKSSDVEKLYKLILAKN